MLQNDFYKITGLKISADKTTANAVIKLNPEHSIFKGHFPEIPVVPGVCTIQMIKEILCEVVKKNIMLVHGNIIKLHNPINPDNNLFLSIDITIKYDSDIIHISSEVYFESLRFCSFRGSFEIQE